MTTYQAIATSLTSTANPTAQSIPQRLNSTDPSRLAPEDAFYACPPPRRQGEKEAYAKVNGGHADTDPIPNGVRSGGNIRRKKDKERGRSGSRRGNGVWKKLLWVKQSCMSDPVCTSNKTQQSND